MMPIVDRQTPVKTLPSLAIGENNERKLFISTRVVSLLTTQGIFHNNADFIIQCPMYLRYF